MTRDTIQRELRISDALVDRFAELTGDRSSLHTDDAFARRTRFRERPAHGMLAVISLAALDESGPAVERVRLESIEGHFREPIGTRDRLALNIDIEADGESHRFAATWTRADRSTVVAVASGRYRLTAPGNPFPTEPPASAQPPCFAELDPDLETLEGRNETLRFTAGRALLERFRSELLVPMGVGRGCAMSPELLAVMMLSPMSGMHLPGRWGASLRFALDFERAVAPGQDYALVGTVRRVQRGAELVTTDLVLEAEDTTVARGSAEAMLTGPPVTMPGPIELRRAYLDLGLKNRVALVVGGSRGIGEVTAKLLALQGAAVALTYYRGARDAEQIVESIRAAGGTAACFACDVRRADQVAAAVDAVTERFGAVDILVNCFVGRSEPSPTVANHWDDYLAELEVSVQGVHALCTAVAPGMQRRKSGKIVNFSAVAARNPMHGQSRYATAKGAVEAYTRNLAKELIRFNIQVNLVVPQMTETDLIAAVPRMFRDRLGAARDYGRHVHPAEAAQAAVFLSSQWSNAMTGQSLVINLGEPPFG